MKDHTGNARISDMLARVVEGPTSPSAIFISSSVSILVACRLAAGTGIDMLTTPTLNTE